MLSGCLIQEGRTASVRPEVFAPLSLVWASDGIALRTANIWARKIRGRYLHVKRTEK